MLAKANKFVFKLGESESSLNAAEYFLIVGMITLVVVFSCTGLDIQVKRVFTAIGSALTQAL